MKRMTSKFVLSLLVPLSVLALAGCGGEQHADLRDFVKKSDDMPRGRIPPLPEVQPYEPFTYNAYDLTDPFKPRKIEPPKTAAKGGIQPDFNRQREALESFPLENLAMVGYSFFRFYLLIGVFCGHDT